MAEVNDLSSSKKAGQDAGLPWTVSRCNRLLRPLASKIPALRRYEIRHHENVEEGKYVKLGNTFAKLAVLSKLSEADLLRVDLLTHRGRARRTYRSYGSTQRHDPPPASPATPGLSDIHLSTPFVEKIREQAQQNPNIEVVDASGLERNVIPTSKRMKKSQCISPRTQSLARDDFISLLNATCEEPEDQTSSRSLFAMCQRQVPAYMLEEKQWRLSQDRDDKSDVENETYKMLEEYGTTSPNGWTLLKGIVKAHGILLIESAVREGLFDNREVGLLLDACRSFCECEANIRIETAFLHSYSSPSLPVRRWDNNHVYRCVQFLDYNSDHKSDLESEPWTHASKFHYMNSTLLEKTAPAEALPSPLVQRTWKLALHALISPNLFASGPACVLLETILLCSSGLNPLATDRLLCKFPKERKSYLRFIEKPAPAYEPTRFASRREPARTLQGTCRGICVYLATLAILPDTSDKTKHNNSTLKFSNVLWNTSVGIMRAYTLPDLLEASRYADLSVVAAQVLFSHVIVLIANKQEGGGDPHCLLIEQRLKFIAGMLTEQQTTSTPTPVSVTKLSQLLSDVARNLQDRGGAIGFDVLQRTCNHFMQYDSEDQQGKNLFRHIALESSMMMSQRTQESTHRKYAANVEASVAKYMATLAPTNVPGKRKNPSLRWEEGLCEWVTATPRLSQPSQLSMNLTGQKLFSQNRLAVCASYGNQPDPSPLRGKTSSCIRSSAAIPVKTQVSSQTEDSEEDELSAPQPSQRTLSNVTNIRQGTLKRGRSPEPRQKDSAPHRMTKGMKFLSGPTLAK